MAAAFSAGYTQIQHFACFHGVIPERNLHVLHVGSLIILNLNKKACEHLPPHHIGLFLYFVRPKHLPATEQRSVHLLLSTGSILSPQSAEGQRMPSHPTQLGLLSGNEFAEAQTVNAR